MDQRQAVERIRILLKQRPRDLLLFELATQQGIQPSRLLTLRARDLFECKAGQPLIIDSDDGNPPQIIPITATLRSRIDRYLTEYSPAPDDVVFRSRKGGGPLTLSGFSRLATSWFRAAGITGFQGTQGLRRLRPQTRETQSAARSKLSGNILEPVAQAPTLGRGVHERLIEAIVSGRFPPGRKLIVDEAARQMGVSRIPVREAFQRLFEAGLLYSSRRGGVYVNQLSTRDFEEITTIRLLLEIDAAKRGARLRSERALREARSIHREWVDVSRRLLKRKSYDLVVKYLALNRKFHQTIYAEAQMPIMLHVIGGLWDRVSPYLHILLMSIEGGVDERTVSIHKRIFDGFAKGDAESVGDWVRKDITEAGQHLVRHFSRSKGRIRVQESRSGMSGSEIVGDKNEPVHVHHTVRHGGH